MQINASCGFSKSMFKECGKEDSEQCRGKDAALLLDTEDVRRVRSGTIIHDCSFHDDMKGTVMYDGATSNPFDILSGMKQGCIPAPTLLRIFSATSLKHAFGESTEGIYLQTRSDENLFKLSRLRANTR